MKIYHFLLFFFFLPHTLSAQSLMDSLVFSSIDDEDYQELARLIQTKKVNIQEVFTKNHETPLHYASFLGRTPAVSILLNTSLSIDAITPQNYTALHLASQQGHLEVVHLLLQHGANPNIRNEDGFLPVHLAASFGHLGVVQVLIQGSDIVDIKGIHHVTPLHLAAQNGHNDILLYLLSLGADPNFSAEGSHGMSLHFAVHGDHPDSVEILLQHGAKVNAVNDTGDTPFVWNGYIGDIESAKILLDAGADKDIITLRFKYNALHTASIRGKTRLIEYFLSQHIFTGNEKSGSGSVGLHYAALYGHLDAVRVLIPVTTSINIQDIYGQTPLHYAVSNNKSNIVRILLDAGADRNMVNTSGESPVQLAKRLNYNHIVQIFQSQ